MRHSTNRNLTLYFEDEYLGLPVQADKGPFIMEYLHPLHQTLHRAISEYREVFAFRFDLRLPLNHTPQGFSYQNEIIDRFIESFKAKIRHNRQIAFRENRYAHDSVVRYVWAREVGQQDRPHYHFAILLNKDAFCALGRYATDGDNMYSRLLEAWASALRLPLHAILGTVHIAKNSRYHIRRDDPASIADFFFRASYLCKAYSKEFGGGGHGFGTSRT